MFGRDVAGVNLNVREWLDKTCSEDWVGEGILALGINENSRSNVDFVGSRVEWDNLIEEYRVLSSWVLNKVLLIKDDEKVVGELLSCDPDIKCDFDSDEVTSTCDSLPVKEDDIIYREHWKDGSRRKDFCIACGNIFYLSKIFQ